MARPQKKLTVSYRPKNQRQKEAVVEWPRTRLMIMKGSAGTGKTAAALGMALTDLFNPDSRISKIVLIRPTETVGEKLGFLPGDLNEKILPYMGAIEDCFEDVSDSGTKSIWELLKDKVSTLPLGMVRGRTFRSSVVIADEMQNAMPAQLKALATRVGTGCKMVLCGDSDQSDIRIEPNPFAVFADTIKNVPGVTTIQFLPEDQQRDPFVNAILEAMDGPAPDQRKRRPRA